MDPSSEGLLIPCFTWQGLPGKPGLEGPQGPVGTYVSDGGDIEGT